MLSLMCKFTSSVTYLVSPYFGWVTLFYSIRFTVRVVRGTYVIMIIYDVEIRSSALIISISYYLVNYFNK